MHLHVLAVFLAVSLAVHQRVPVRIGAQLQL